MPRFAPLPDRRPAVVAGASSGIGEATAHRTRRARLPGRARRPPRGEARRPRRQDPRRRRRGRRLPPRRHRPELGRSRFVRKAVDALGDIEVLVAGAGDTYFGKLAEITTDEFDSQLQIHLVGANRLAAAVLPGMIERQRGDLIFVGSDVALRQRPAHGRLRRRQGRARRDGDQPSDGTRGHRGAGVDRAPRARRRPTWAGACPPS